MTFLVIGIGHAGRRHAANLEMLGHRVVTADSNPLRGAITDPDGLMTAMKESQGVVVATPPAQHAAYAVLASMVQRPLFIEKPLTQTLAEARDLYDTISSHNNCVLLGYNLRWNESLRAFKAGYAGWQGQLHVCYRGDMAAWPRPTYERDGLLECSHELDVALWLRPESRLRVVEWSGVQAVNVHLTWPGGHMWLELDWGSPAPARFVEGIGSRCWRWEFERIENEAAYLAEMAHFVEVCEGRAAPSCTLADGLRVMELAEEVRACKCETTTTT